jgi:alkanesulfonate monooxygenase SsuD/methylene tetrahydromethanopterin reductase-like flavin-dependent oxidoreductase (luciferase family)
MIMSMKYSVALPQMVVQMKGIKDPAEAFEAMIRIAQTVEECGYEAVWLGDHFMPLVQEVQRRL